MITVDGAELHSEARGSGPALLFIPGALGDGGVFAPMVQLLADEYTVVTYDRRGNSRSPVTGPAKPMSVAEQSDDAVAVLAHHGFSEALVLGSSAGAVIGLDLAARHPQVVTGLIAHEPPAVQVLPDAARWLAFFADLDRITRTEGPWPAFVTFMAVNSRESLAALFRHRPVRRLAAGVLQGLLRQLSGRPSPLLRLSVQALRRVLRKPPPDLTDPAVQALREAPARSMGNAAHFMTREMAAIVDFTPDYAALTAGGARIVVGVGHDSRHHYYSRTSPVIAERLAAPCVEFPGGHTPYVDQAPEFAVALRAALADLRGIPTSPDRGT
jgi:pimeloyl-ACP methyl ester carboxylesterase